MRDAQRTELIDAIGRVLPSAGVIDTALGVRLRRADAPADLGHGSSFPSFCVIAQGSKELRLGDRRYRYDEAHFLVSTATLPIASRVLDASDRRPYLGVVVMLDPSLVGSVMVEAGRPAARERAGLSAIAVNPLDDALLDATVRLVNVLSAPADAPFLAPLIKREIVYRLLTSEQGNRVRQIATLGGETNRMAEAIARLRTNFDKSIRIEDLAQDLGMSVSGFHHHFKQVTAMSPLQFQKQLRLQEARRLMLSGDFDATTAGNRVGYDDASQFSREYKRLFGEPPLRDIGRLRNAPLESAPM